MAAMTPIDILVGVDIGGSHIGYGFLANQMTDHSNHFKTMETKFMSINQTSEPHIVIAWNYCIHC